MIRRLEMAAAILHMPHVLFLDEPTLGLDPIARETLWDHLREMQASTNTTVLLTTTTWRRPTSCATGSPSCIRASSRAKAARQSSRRRSGPTRTLGDVFTHLAGSKLEEGGTYGEVARARRTARRVG